MTDVGNGSPGNAKGERPSVLVVQHRCSQNKDLRNERDHYLAFVEAFVVEKNILAPAKSAPNRLKHAGQIAHLSTGKTNDES